MEGPKNRSFSGPGGRSQHLVTSGLSPRLTRPRQSRSRPWSQTEPLAGEPHSFRQPTFPPATSLSPAVSSCPAPLRPGTSGLGAKLLFKNRLMPNTSTETDRQRGVTLTGV